MKISSASPCLSIRTKHVHNVKLRHWLGLSLAAIGLEAIAAPSPETQITPLPEIEARTYTASTVRHSSSKRIYLFETPGHESARPGRIILLKRNDEPIMAFRIMKLYPDLRQFAAKRVKHYGGVQALRPGEAFSAVEKVSDIIPALPTPKDQADLKELEVSMSADPKTLSVSPASTPSPSVPKNIKSYDPELDAGSSPPPGENSGSDAAQQDPAFFDENSGGPDPSALTINEVQPFDIHQHWITASFGAFRNNGLSGTPAYFAGGGFRYGYSLGKMLALGKARIQDSLAAEAGVFLYKLVNFVPNQNDAYSVAPVIFTLRYNVLFGENLSLFFYGGIMRNIVIATSQESGEAKLALNSLLPAIGTGFLFRVGPSWDARLDLGFDVVGVGLVLRF